MPIPAGERGISVLRSVPRLTGGQALYCGPGVWDPVPSTIFDNIFVRTGELAPESGYYIYKGNPKRGVLPCIPTRGEKVITLERGEAVPPVRSCCNHAAVYRLTISTE